MELDNITLKDEVIILTVKTENIVIFDQEKTKEIDSVLLVFKEDHDRIVKRLKKEIYGLKSKS